MQRAFAEGVAEGLVVEDGLVAEEGAAKAGAEPAADYAMMATVLTMPTTRENGLLKKPLTMRREAIGTKGVRGC